MMTTQQIKITAPSDEKSTATPVKPITPPASQSYLSFFWQSSKEKAAMPKASPLPQVITTVPDTKNEAPNKETPANALKTSASVYEMGKEEYKEQPENVDIETASSIDPFLVDEPTLSYIGRIFKCLTMPGR